MAAARIESSARLKPIDGQRDVPGSTHDDLEPAEVVGLREAWGARFWSEGQLDNDDASDP
jgi:hypothetical protein